MADKNIRDAPLEKLIWAKIRFYQQVLGLSNALLADYLCICTKTLRSYDKNAENLNLAQIASFLEQTELTINDIVPSVDQ